MNNHLMRELTCPKLPLDITHISAGFSMAAMTRAASNSFSQVLRRLIMAVPN